MTDDQINRLGEVLYSKMEHLDPSIDFCPWEALSEREREFYRLCAEAVIEAHAECGAGSGDAS